VTTGPENKWPADGHDHHLIDRSNIYENSKIRSFLDGTNVTLLIAGKGMGKTLLLRVKKKLLTGNRSGLTLIPAINAEFDEPKLHGTFPASGYSDVLLWKDLWTFAIVISALSHLPTHAQDLTKTKLKLERLISKLELDVKFKEQLLEDAISSAEHVPSHYLAHLVENYSESELQKFRKSMHVIDDLSDKHIVSGVAVFIDAFDQSLQEAFPANLDAWRAGQLGLIKAAHTLFTKNHHVKVFATIRQEAWAGFLDADRQVIKGKSLILEPTEIDLKRIFLGAVTRNTQFETIEGFLGVDKVENVYCNQSEDCFKYLLRHSSGSPRSLMQFGKALDEAELLEYSDEERMRRLRDVVDDTSAENIVVDYLESQKQMFMKTLDTETKLRELLRLIPSNVLTAESLKSINNRFCMATGVDPGKSHPFCELFNSGLIGEVRLDVASGGHFQYFRKSYEFDWVQEEILKSDTIYVVHPGLTSHVAKIRDMFFNKFNVIGPDYQWKELGGHYGVPKIFVSHASVDMIALAPFLTVLKDELNLIVPSHIWLEKDRILAGEEIESAVADGVKSSDILVLFASQASLDSGWVKKEWASKLHDEVKERQIRVVVAIIDSTPPEALPTFLQGKLAAICPLGGAEPSNALELARAIATHSQKHLNSVFKSI
jgi:hypothetical protein